MFRKITTPFDYRFDIPERGVYSITLEASCTSGMIFGLFGGEDLRIEIDGRSFREIPPQKRTQLFNIPLAWNGTQLNGNTKSVVFVLSLAAGTHTITFIPKRGATIVQEPAIQLFNPHTSLFTNFQSHERNRQPWITIALVDLPLRTLDVSVTCKKRPRDSDDVKLIIDGMLQKNQQTSWWGRDWYWRGSQLRGATEEARFYPTLPAAIHYIELWADRTPLLNELALTIGEDGNDGGGTSVHHGRIALYDDIEKAAFVRLRELPTRKSLERGHVRDGEEVAIVEKEVTGEYITNKSDIWHKVKYGDTTGYVLSSFIEIEDQERAAIIEKIRRFAKKHGVDEHLAVALAGCESHYKPYAVSYTRALGIFQLTTSAREKVWESFKFNITTAESFDIDTNIEAGILYLSWVARSYEGAKDAKQKIIAAWNVGVNAVSANGAFRIDAIRASHAKKKEVQRLVDCVTRNNNKKNGVFIAALFLIMFLMVGGGGAYAVQKNNKGYLRWSDSGISFSFHNVFQDRAVNAVSMYSITPYIVSGSTTRIDYVIDGERKYIDLPGYLENAYMLGNMYYRDTFLFVVREIGHALYTSIVRYDPRLRDLVLVPFVEADGTHNTDLCCAYITFSPSSYANYTLVMYDVRAYSHMPSAKREYNYDSEQQTFVLR